MISKQLLAATNFEAPLICVYGGPGLKKSHAIHSMVPRTLVFQFESGGSSSYLPWINRVRDSDSKEWQVFSQADRERFASMTNPDKVEPSLIKPGPYVDVIMYDITKFETWATFKADLGNFDYKQYNGMAIDSLQEMSWDTRTHVRGARTETLMTDIPFSWVRAQELAQMALRQLGSFRRGGVFAYLIGAETIAKDYVKSPMEKKEKGEQNQEPYSIKGTVDLPGQLASSIGHGPDILMHARLMNNKPIWVTEPEMLTGGVAWWDGKDRYGRLPQLVYPNFRTILDKLYGEEGRKAIYASARENLAA